MESNIIKKDLSKYLFSKASKSKVPLSGALEISPLCNMDCKMCYIKMTKDEMRGVGKERSVEDWIKLAEEAKKSGTLFLLLTGGEPFLHPGFKELYIKLYKMGFILSINTNGTLINEETIEWLSKYKPMRVNVTLYGSSNETYEKLCDNKKGFSQATRGILLLKKANIPVKINSSITQYNMCDIEGIHEFGNKHELVVQATSYMYPPVRRDENAIGKNERFTPKEAAINYVKINELRMSEDKFKNNIINETNTCGDLVDEYIDIEGEPMKCRAGKSTFWITWDGRMLACGMMNNIVAYPFKDGFFESWNKIVNDTSKIRLPKECTVCKNKSNCKVCAAISYTETGGTSQKPIYMCNMTREVIKESKRKYKELL